MASVALDKSCDHVPIRNEYMFGDWWVCKYCSWPFKVIYPRDKNENGAITLMLEPLSHDKARLWFRGEIK